MNPRSDFLTTLVRRVVALGILVALGACAPLVLEMEGPATVRMNAQASGGIFVIRVPEDRPEGGVEVRRPGRSSFRIPPGHYPAPGECRIWRPEVPPGRQDPPGSCSVLRQQVPAGAYLVEG